MIFIIAKNLQTHIAAVNAVDVTVVVVVVINATNTVFTLCCFMTTLM